MTTMSRASMSIWTMLRASTALLAIAGAGTVYLMSGLGIAYPDVLWYVVPLVFAAIALPVLYLTLNILSSGARGRGEVSYADDSRS